MSIDQISTDNSNLRDEVSTWSPAENVRKEVIEDEVVVICIAIVCMAVVAVVVVCRTVVVAARDRRVGPGPDRVRKSSIDRVRVQIFGTRRSPPHNKDQL